MYENSLLNFNETDLFRLSCFFFYAGYIKIRTSNEKYSSINVLIVFLFKIIYNILQYIVLLAYINITLRKQTVISLL